MDCPSNDGRKERSDGIACRYGVAADRVTIVHSLVSPKRKAPDKGALNYRLSYIKYNDFKTAVRRCSAYATQSLSVKDCPSQPDEQ